LVEFKQGKSVMAQKRRSEFLNNFANIFADTGCIELIPQVEVILTGCRGCFGVLRADFFIPELPRVIEVHGEQHYKYVKHFHKSETDFAVAQKNDLIKQEWCNLNEIGYVELPFNKIKEWKKIINAALE
jgi:hypothetical protein